MNLINPVNLITLERLGKAEKRLTQKTTEELISLVKKGFEWMVDIPKNGKHYMEAALSLPETHPIYEGGAALRLIEKREGEEYAMNLIGLRGPETFFERIKYFFCGVPFEIAH